MFIRRRRNVKRRVSRKTGIRSKKSSKVAAPLKSYVNRIIRRNEETKFVSNQYTLTSFNAGINATGDLITVLPAVTQGASENTRVGSKIRPVKLVIKGYVIYNCVQTLGYASAKMLGSRLFCFQDKTTRSYVNTSVVNYNLLDLGGASSNYIGTAMNFIAPHNNDQFTFYADKRMKFQKPYGVVNSTTPSSSVDITGMDNSMFHPFTITLTAKQLPAVLTYDQTSSPSYPTNFAPFMALGYSDLFNFTPDVGTQQLQMEFCSTLYYKDA